MSEYLFTINGLSVTASFNEKDVNRYFLPILKTFEKLQKSLDRRIIVYLSAPPGSGKSTFVYFLEDLARKNNIELQSIGIDGFHYYQEYLDTHYLNNSDVLLSSIKGSPNTFDVEKLKEKIIKLQTENVYWPIYSRTVHDPIQDQIYVYKNIVLIEGNYLLYNKDNWKDLIKYCDLSIYININEDILKERLVNRKIMGGSTSQQALIHYEKTDKVNIDLVSNNHYKADIEIVFDKNNNVIEFIT